MPRSARAGKGFTSLIARIDQALIDIPEIRSGAEPYLRRVAELGLTEADLTPELLRPVAVDVAAQLYADQADAPVEFLEFVDGAFDVLFDAANELTVLMHGLSKSTPANSRDTKYHKGFPGREGFDKGHAMAHAQGGREGGPNYFLQSPKVNRRGTPMGDLWRDIETYLAAHPGLFSFVRLTYPGAVSTDVPNEVEYGVLAEGAFRAVIFPNPQP